MNPWFEGIGHVPHPFDTSALLQILLFHLLSKGANRCHSVPGSAMPQGGSGDILEGGYPWRNPWKPAPILENQKGPDCCRTPFLLVAGVGFEPTTFGL